MKQRGYRKVVLINNDTGEELMWFSSANVASKFLGISSRATYQAVEFNWTIKKIWKLKPYEL